MSGTVCGWGHPSVDKESGGVFIAGVSGGDGTLRGGGNMLGTLAGVKEK
jgi:hypothetical protein